MRFHILASAILATGAVMPSAAEIGPLTGDVQLMYGYGAVDSNNGNDFQDDVRELSAQLRVGYQLENGIFLQGDATHLTGEGYDAGAPESELDAFSIGLHAGYRTDIFHVGAFYSYLQTNEINLPFSPDIGWNTFGGEAQFHTGAFSLYAQGGWAEERDGRIAILHDFAFGRLGGRYFVDPNLRLSAEVLYGEGTVEGIDSAPLFHWSLEARKRFDDTPTAVFVRFERGDFRNEGETPNDVLEDYTVVIGLSVAFNAPTLQDFEQNGASLGSPNAVMRYMGYSQDYD